MRSDLFLIPFEVGGVPIFGFGVLLLLWALAAGVFAWRVGRKPGGGAELKANMPYFVAVAAVIIGLPLVLDEGLPIRGYGVMLLLAGSTGLAMAIHRGRQHGMTADDVVSLAFGMFVLGIIGARLFFVIEYWDRGFGADGIWQGLKKAVLFTQGGLVVYGSLIGATIAFLWYVWRRRWPALAVADILAPSLAAGLALGRIGCLLNGCCYGGQCDQPWAVTFPMQSAANRMSPPYEDQLSRGEFHGFRWEVDPDLGHCVVTRVNLDPAPAGLEPGAVINSIQGLQVESPDQLRFRMVAAYKNEKPLRLGLSDGAVVVLPAAALRKRSLPVHPTQIYSAVNAGLLAWFLWLYYPLRRRDGAVIGLLLTLYPIGRFLLEIIRTDESAIFGTGLSISQNVSILLLVSMVGYWGYLMRGPGHLSEGFATPEPAATA